MGRAERREREPVAVGLLPGKPSVSSKPRTKHSGARIRDIGRHGCAQQGPPRRISLTREPRERL
jgi:hypothetical protein